MAAARKSGRASTVLLWGGCFAVLLVVIAISGLSLVDQAHEMRGLYSTMAEVQQQQDGLLEEHSRLMLERSTLSSMQTIEAVAESELDMHFPEGVGEVLR